MHTTGAYPAVVADTGVVVKVFGDRWSGPEMHRAEREALLQQRRLSDASFAMLDQDLTLTSPNGLQHPIEFATLAPPAAQHRQKRIGHT
jgi:hypothetical protein